MGVLLKPKPLAKKRMSVREFLALPPDEAFETELVYGEMIAMPKPGADHNDLMVDLGDLLRRWVRFYLLGRICFDIDIILDEDNALVYAPIFFLSQRRTCTGFEGPVYGPADLAIEIKSPSDRPSRQMSSMPITSATVFRGTGSSTRSATNRRWRSTTGEWHLRHTQ